MPSAPQAEKSEVLDREKGWRSGVPKTRVVALCVYGGNPLSQGSVAHFWPENG